ncbi:MAG: polysaccharide biosynthesis tyrosine autokinase [Phycisphaerales bacterium]
MSDGLLLVVWRNRWFMMASVVAAMVVGVIYVRSATPIYTSTARLYLDYAGLRIANSFEPGNVPKTDKYLNTQAGLICSRPILSLAVESLSSQRLRTFLDVEMPAAHVKQNLNVNVGAKDEIISVSFRCPYPDEAAAVVNSIVHAYMTSRSERGQRNFAQLLKFLQDNMDSARRELDRKQQEVTDYQRNGMPLSLGSAQGGAIVQRYMGLQAEYTQAQIRRMQAQTLRQAVQILAGDPAALRQYARSSGNLGSSMGMEAETTPLESRIVDLAMQRESISGTASPDHPVVAGLTSELAWAQTRLDGVDERFVKAMRMAVERQYADANEYEEHLVALCREEGQRVVLLNAELEQYQRLQSEVEALRAHYQGLDDEIRELSKVMGEDVDQLRMEILEPASPPQTPSEPQKDRVLALALVLGLLLGGGISLARDQLDQTIRSAEEIPGLLKLPVLGTVPAMSRRQEIPERGRSILLRPDSPEAEAFRTVRTAVFFGAPQERVKTILITSPAPGDGKSTLTSNLAIAMAIAGQKILVLDADFRRPMQHTIFGVDHRQRCLRNVLAGKMTLRAAIQATGDRGPHLLTFGQGGSNPAEVLGSRQFALVLERLGRVYDRILIDAPPVTVVADAQIVSTLSDVTVVVLKAGKSTRRASCHTVAALQSVGARILGVVINETHRSGDRYSYHYRQYYRSTDGEPRNGKRTPMPNEPVAGSASK